MDHPFSDLLEQVTGHMGEVQPEKQAIRANSQETYHGPKDPPATPTDQAHASHPSQHSTMPDIQENEATLVNQPLEPSTSTQNSRPNEQFTRSIAQKEGDWRQLVGTPAYYPWFRRPATDAWDTSDDRYLIDAYYRGKSWVETSHNFDTKYFQRSPQHCEVRIKELIEARWIVARR